VFVSLILREPAGAGSQDPRERTLRIRYLPEDTPELP
jgi:hypothetical protein